MSDDIRDRLGGIDPARRLPDVDETSLADLMEDIMTTDLDRHDDRTADPPRRVGASRRRRMALAVSGVAACAALAVGLAVTVGSDDDAGSEPLTLAGSGDDSLASCLPVTAEFMADMPVAFAATAVDVDGDVVVLAVEEWFAGEPFDEVVVTQADDASVALIGGVRYAEGERYLITAAEGQVNSCGYSGPDTAELRSVFEQAFGL